MQTLDDSTKKPKSSGEPRGKPKPPSDQISLEEVRECLSRSGYLLESRLVRSLSELGYFVEPNQVIKDPRTGKSREIDLVAEYFNYTPQRPKVAVKTHFVIEAINNKFPFVLLTERPYSPAADFESYIKFVVTPESNPFVGEIDPYEEKEAHWENLFSQFCVLTRKQNNKELMASHPDDVYSSLLKLTEYVEAEVNEWLGRESSQSDTYWRLFFWHPMLVLSGQLFSARVGDDGIVDLNEIPIGRLEFNWHAEDERRTTVIEVVTEEHFVRRLTEINTKDDELEQRMHNFRQRVDPVASSKTSSVKQ